MKFKRMYVHGSSYTNELSGKIEFEGTHGEIALNLNDETCRKMFLLVADGLVDVAKETASKLTEEAFRKQTVLLENDGTQ